MKDGGRAFPNVGDGDNWDGMTLLDYFAAKALQIIPQIAKDVYCNEGIWDSEGYAKESYKIAQAMLKEREALRAEGDGGRK